MNNKKTENSVKNLMNLYIVVMGLALTLAISKLVDSESGLRALTPSSGLLFYAFIVTLFPFYHGALRHLDDAYIENENANIRDGALILDFLLLLLHGIVFVVLAILISTPNHFAWTLISVLAVDVLWGLFAYFGSSSQSKHYAEGKWAIINSIFVALAAWYLIANDIYLAKMDAPIKLAVPIAIACTFRTLADYIWAKDFYFPKD